MTFDLQHIIESKRAHRQNLAALPIAEKLRMLDAMRERELAIRGQGIPMDAGSRIVSEEAYPYRCGRK